MLLTIPYLIFSLLALLNFDCFGIQGSIVVEAIDTKAAINKLAADALNNFVGITQSFIDVARKDEMVVDTIRLHNQLREPIDYQCDFLNDDKRTTLAAGQVVVATRKRTYGEGYWTCCKFIRTKSNRVLPQRSHLFDAYLALERMEKSGKERHVRVGSNGVSIYLPSEGDAFNRRTKGENKLLAGWNWKTGHVPCPRLTNSTGSVNGTNEQELVVQLTLLIIRLSQILQAREVRNPILNWHRMEAIINRNSSLFDLSNVQELDSALNYFYSKVPKINTARCQEEAQDIEVHLMQEINSSRTTSTLKTTSKIIPITTIATTATTTTSTSATTTTKPRNTIPAPVETTTRIPTAIVLENTPPPPITFLDNF